MPTYEEFSIPGKQAPPSQTQNIRTIIERAGIPDDLQDALAEVLTEITTTRSEDNRRSFVEIERYMQRLAPPTIVASAPGAFVPSITSPWPPRRSGSVAKYLLFLDTAGTSNTVVDLKINGTAVKTLTLGSGATYIEVVNPPNVSIKTSDRIQFQITSAGTGALGLTAAVWLGL